MQSPSSGTGSNQGPDATATPRSSKSPQRAGGARGKLRSLFSRKAERAGARTGALVRQAVVPDEGIALFDRSTASFRGGALASGRGALLRPRVLLVAVAEPEVEASKSDARSDGPDDDARGLGDGPNAGNSTFLCVVPISRIVSFAAGRSRQKTGATLFASSLFGAGGAHSVTVTFRARGGEREEWNWDMCACAPEDATADAVAPADDTGRGAGAESSVTSPEPVDVVENSGSVPPDAPPPYALAESGAGGARVVEIFLDSKSARDLWVEALGDLTRAWSSCEWVPRAGHHGDANANADPDADANADPDADADAARKNGVVLFEDDELAGDQASSLRAVLRDPFCERFDEGAVSSAAESAAVRKLIRDAVGRGKTGSYSVEGAQMVASPARKAMAGTSHRSSFESDVSGGSDSGTSGKEGYPDRPHDDAKHPGAGATVTTPALVGVHDDNDASDAGGSQVPKGGASKTGGGRWGASILKRFSKRGKQIRGRQGDNGSDGGCSVRTGSLDEDAPGIDSIGIRSVAEDELAALALDTGVPETQGRNPRRRGSAGHHRRVKSEDVSAHLARPTGVEIHRSVGAKRPPRAASPANSRAGGGAGRKDPEDRGSRDENIDDAAGLETASSAGRLPASTSLTACSSSSSASSSSSSSTSSSSPGAKLHNAPPSSSFKSFLSQFAGGLGPAELGMWFVILTVINLAAYWIPFARILWLLLTDVAVIYFVNRRRVHHERYEALERTLSDLKKDR